MISRAVRTGAAALVLAAALASGARASKPELRAEVEAGIDALYRMDFDDAARHCDRMRVLEPGHPFGEFGHAALLWARYTYGTEMGDDTLIKPFEAQVDRTVETGKAWVKAHPGDAEALMALGAAEGIMARMYVTRRQYLRGYWSGRAAMKGTRAAVAADPNLIDAQLGLGMYDYYTDLYPRMIRALAKVILRGDRARGIERLKLVAEKGTWAAVAAKMLLVEISLHDPYGARDPQKAVKLMEEVRAKYPTSAMLHSAQLAALYQAGRLEEANKGALDFVRKTEDGRYRRFDKPKGMVFLGASLWALKRPEDALAAYRRAYEEKPRNRWAVWALIRAGNVLDLLNRRSDAVQHYKEALSEPDRWGYKEYAERALKRPFVLEGEFTVDPR
ncbi:tetratricopeptide repeat protein [bacterium]|nr:MAG: tetratricopeptide repeat protein [bacterium]